VGIATLGFVLGKGRLGLVALITGSAAVLVLAQSNWLVLSLCMLVLFGISQSCFIVSNNTLVQSLVPDTLRGRITSLYMLEHGLGPVAIFVIALFMDRYTVEGALTVVGAMGVGISVFFMFAFQQVRRLE
jgi:sugar phosphate permease